MQKFKGNVNINFCTRHRSGISDIYIASKWHTNIGFSIKKKNKKMVQINKCQAKPGYKKEKIEFFSFKKRKFGFSDS